MPSPSDTRPFLLEEPLPPEDIDGLALLRQNTKVQLAAGEKIAKVSLDLPIRDLLASQFFHVQRQGDKSDFVKLA